MTCVKNRSTTNFVSFLVSFSTDTGTVNYDQNVLFQEEVPIKEAILSVLKHGSMKQVELVEATKPLVTAGEKRIRSVLSKIVALGLVSVKQVKTAKVYSLNTNNIEPGYFDAMDEQDATLMHYLSKLRFPDLREVYITNRQNTKNRPIFQNVGQDLCGFLRCLFVCL